MTSEAITKHGTSWSTIVSNSLKTKVSPPRSRYDIKGNKESYSIETLFEEAEVAAYLRSQRVNAIVQTAIQPGAVIFSVPSRYFSHQSEAFRCVVDQIGPVVCNYFNPISLRGQRTRGDLVFYTKFKDDTHTKQALETGFTHEGVQYTAVSYKDKTEANDYCRVTLTLPLSDEPALLVEKLIESMSNYGRVLQIKQRLNHGFFEGDVSVLLDRRTTQTEPQYQDLQRMLYLEAWDITAPASHKGAQPICYYCREAGHIKKDCLALQNLICFRCGGAGHTQCRCRVPNVETAAAEPEKETSFAEDLHRKN